MGWDQALAAFVAPSIVLVVLLLAERDRGTVVGGAYVVAFSRHLTRFFYVLPVVFGVVVGGATLARGDDPVLVLAGCGAFFAASWPVAFALDRYQLRVDHEGIRMRGMFSCREVPWASPMSIRWSPWAASLVLRVDGQTFWANRDMKNVGALAEDVLRRFDDLDEQTVTVLQRWRNDGAAPA